jgi:hypothetical protein
MRSADILQQLTKPRILEIARDLRLEVAGLSKDELVERISKSLAHRTDEDGEVLGWIGAINAVVARLGKADAIRVFGTQVWEGLRAHYATNSRLRHVPLAGLREMLASLALAEEDGGRGRPMPSEAVDEVCNRPGWCQAFDSGPPDGSWRGGDEDEDSAQAQNSPDIGREGADEQVESTSPHALAEEEWTHEDLYRGGPGVRLPEGIEISEEPLFKHQERSLARLDAWWRSNEAAGVLCLPTGAGKTRTATVFIHRYLASPSS